MCRSSSSWKFGAIGLVVTVLVTSINEISSSSSNTAPGTSSNQATKTGFDDKVNCTSASGQSMNMIGKLYMKAAVTVDPSAPDQAKTSGNSAKRTLSFTTLLAQDLGESSNVSLDDSRGYCVSSYASVKEPGESKYIFGHYWKNDDNKCPSATLLSQALLQRRTSDLLLIFVPGATGATGLRIPTTESMPEKVIIFIADSIIPTDYDPKFHVSTSFTCQLSLISPDDNANQQDSLLNNFSRTSVLFVSVSFIILMVISLAWLVFYYVQRFRYAHAKDRLARRLFNAAKKALTKIPAKSLRQGDKELDSDCPVCIEPYHAGDVIRILPCKHVFHKTCVDPWLLEHRTCPMCKMDILKAFGYHFGHSEESVRDADQISAGGQSTDGGSGGTGAGGRAGSGAQHGFPMSLPTDSDLHDPFFPSPIPSPSLLQPVLHSSNATSFTIIPLTVHRHHGGGGSAFSGARGSDSSADSADNWVTGGIIQRQHSAEVHHGAGIGSNGVETQNKTTATMDDNHNDMTTIQRHSTAHHNRRPHRHREVAAMPSNVSTSSSSSTSSTGQQRQPLFHSRSAGMLQGGGPVNTVDSCESDDGTAPVVDARKHSVASTKRRRQEELANQQNHHKFSAIVSRGRSASQTISSASNKARVAVSSTPSPTAAGQVTTTTTVIGRTSLSSLSSASDCVVVGVVNSNSTGRIASSSSKGRKSRNAVGEQPKGSASLESL